VYPDNRVVVNYGEKHDLTLLYAADTKTGAEQPYRELVRLADTLGCPAVAVHGAAVVGAAETDHVKLRAAVMEAFGKGGLKGNDAEGFVLVGSMPDGTLLRAKIKYDAYLLLHRAFSGNLTDMTVWQAAVSESITDLLDTLPDECYPSVHAVYTRLAERVASVKGRAAEVLKTLPADASPRDASIVIKAAGSLGPLLFAVRSHGWDSPVVEERAWKVVKPDKATVIVMRTMGDGAMAVAAGEETEDA
jgi:RNA ligase